MYDTRKKVSGLYVRNSDRYRMILSTIIHWEIRANKYRVLSTIVFSIIYRCPLLSNALYDA